jgi:hypothetical protein
MTGNHLTFDMAFLRPCFAAFIAQILVARAAAQSRQFVGKTPGLAGGFQALRLRASKRV